MSPTAKFAELSGDTAIIEIEDSVAAEDEVAAVVEGAGAATVKTTELLVTPDMVAVMLAFPVDTPVAKPMEFIVATLFVSLLHVTEEEMSCVEPSE